MIIIPQKICYGCNKVLTNDYKIIVHDIYLCDQCSTINASTLVYHAYSTAAAGNLESLLSYFDKAGKISLYCVTWPHSLILDKSLSDGSSLYFTTPNAGFPFPINEGTFGYCNEVENFSNFKITDFVVFVLVTQDSYRVDRVPLFQIHTEKGSWGIVPKWAIK